MISPSTRDILADVSALLVDLGDAPTTREVYRDEWLQAEADLDHLHITGHLPDGFRESADSLGEIDQTEAALTCCSLHRPVSDKQHSLCSVCLVDGRCRCALCVDVRHSSSSSVGGVAAPGGGNRAGALLVTLTVGVLVGWRIGRGQGLVAVGELTR